jgi:hypothetical protein
MLVELVIELKGKKHVSYLNLPEDSCNILKITPRKFASIKKEWRNRTKDMTKLSDIISEFYDLLDERDIDWTDSDGPDMVIEW